MRNPSLFKLIFVFLAGLSVFTIGCGTTYVPGNALDKPIIDYSLKEINQLIEQGDYLRAVSIVFSRHSDNPDSKELYKNSLEGAQRNFEKILQEKDWKKALIYLRSLELIDGLPPNTKVSEIDLLLQAVNEYLESGKSGAAAAFFMSHIEAENIVEEEQKRLASIFREKKHLGPAQKLDGKEREKPPISRLIDGTVTIWVNRGMRMVGNVGVPDRGIGSGFFIDPEGYIITNYHVIKSEVDSEYEGYSRLYIKLDAQSKERIPAKVVGWEENFDLALLKTEIDAPYVFDYSSGRLPTPGDNVKAIGSPGGLVRTITSGTISALQRSIQTISDSMQIDVPINPGNSGGPLLNDNGEVIGVIFAGVKSFEGINFAIPVSYLTQLTPAMYDGGHIELPWLGITGWDTGDQIQVIYVIPGSPALDAGIMIGDKILTLNGVEYNSIRDIQKQLLSMYPGTMVKLGLEREDKTFNVLTILGVRPEVPLEKAFNLDRRDNLLLPIFGMSAEKISNGLFYPHYRITSVLPGSIADEAGFSVGDDYSLVKWLRDFEKGFTALQMIIRTRKAGFLESPIQIKNYLNIHEVF